MFLTQTEFGLLIDGMQGQYKTLAQFLVMTGARFGEATALKVADIDLLSKPPTARINKAWKRGGQSDYYIGPTKIGAGKRTIGLNLALVDLLIPLVADEDMTAVAGARSGLKAHQDSVRLPEAELVRDLRDILGAKLVAYIGSVKETRAVRQWADGERKPSAEVMTRLRHAYPALLA